MSLAARLRPQGRRALSTLVNSTRIRGGFRHSRNEIAVSYSSRSSNQTSEDSGSSSLSVGRYLKAWPASASETGKKQPRTRSSRSSRAVSGSQGDQEGKSIKPRLDLMLRADKEKRLEKKQRKEVM